MKKLFLTLSLSAAALAAPTPDELLKASDRSRGGIEKGVEWDVDIASDEGGDHSQRSFSVKARGDDALVTATAPARNKGEVFLFNDRVLWFFKPGLRKPVSISARQKLSGVAANGDIASTHYSRDYEGKIVKQDKVDSEPTHVLELKGRSKNVTYDRIRYWIGVKSKLGLKAEFLSLDGDVLKRAHFTYGNTIKEGGKSYPFVSRVVIEDAFVKGNKSTLTYHAPKAAELAPSLFNVNGLMR